MNARIFFLDLSGGRVLSATPDGGDLKTLVVEGRRLPDGLAVDVETLVDTSRGAARPGPQPAGVSVLP